MEPPGKNCGACGSQTCSDFLDRAGAGLVELELCPFYEKNNIINQDNLLSRNNVLSQSSTLSQDGILSRENLLSREKLAIQARNINYSGVDVVGKEYDFVLLPFPGEPSARKFIVPFRADLVEKWDIKKRRPCDRQAGRSWMSCLSCFKSSQCKPGYRGY
ncbi:(Fe-S)-binding protein [Methanosarcina horonobensis]|uniref:(Fe-S)-binding protein n=1 Tax=Methanosarcina horonobensis TaxID=418008 RepID=UPI0022B880AE|nr:(Fe-S)-binding protein [Methanosarcina horonobensis]